MNGLPDGLVYRSDSTTALEFSPETSDAGPLSLVQNSTVGSSAAFEALSRIGEMIKGPAFPNILMLLSCQPREIFPFAAIAAATAFRGVSRKMPALKASGDGPFRSGQTPVVIGIYYSNSNTERHKAIIDEAYAGGARTVGLELADDGLNDGYFSMLADYASSLGMRVIPLLDRRSYVDMLAANYLVSMLRPEGSFDHERLDILSGTIDMLVSKGEALVLSGRATEVQRKEFGLALRRLEILSRVREMSIIADGDISKTAGLWAEYGRARPLRAIASVIAEQRPDISLVSESYARGMEGGLEGVVSRYPDKELNYAKENPADPLLGEFVDSMRLVGRLGDIRDSIEKAIAVFEYLFMIFLQEREIIDRSMTAEGFHDILKGNPSGIVAYAASFRKGIEGSPWTVRMAMWAMSSKRRELVVYFTPEQLFQFYRYSSLDAEKAIREELRPKIALPMAPEGERSYDPASPLMEDGPVYKGMTEAERIAKAVQGNEVDLMNLCSDPSPVVIRRVIDNPRFGLVHARLIAEHHHTAAGLEMLAAKGGAMGDEAVKGKLLRNHQTPAGILVRMFRSMQIENVFTLLNGNDMAEKARAAALAVFRESFRNESKAEEWARFIIRNEGRCLRFLYGERISKKLVDEFVRHTNDITLTLVRNLSSFPGLPRRLVEHILTLHIVRSNPELRKIMLGKIKDGASI